jgi:hypothetical protein
MLRGSVLVQVGQRQPMTGTPYEVDVPRNRTSITVTIA